ncbi:3-oxoacid CoA-transferase/3-oxoadipate CoA-transferase alpha subunit [Palleronia aestuarii]|uniref:3-oxoacid CoA-transferase/3-oxoadipate CoA-transferase alpha subunit n=1 Tax=Palleronia aestuarii TaxID=568105 RepID=A0A2W7NIX3_9RHOB|nr:3-oxoacid CoA-transferase subunit A [Palleronia aestuarii]PZX11222.1 3-oxoacid CoA-transferase/3-oxoadipate CoA-transferase alpha subunit [Palleronia aestuarii]
MVLICEATSEALAGIGDGATIMVGGFGLAGVPFGLLDALLEGGARDLTIISNNAGQEENALALLFRERRVAKLVASYPRTSGSIWFETRWQAGEVALELVPQGTLAERIRAAAAGLGGFFTPTGYGTALAEGKETRMIDGRGYVLEDPLPADVALIRAEEADAWGNLRYRATARNFNPVMAMAGRLTIVEIRRILTEPIDPETVVTPGIFVDRLVVHDHR